MESGQFENNPITIPEENTLPEETTMDDKASVCSIDDENNSTAVEATDKTSKH